MNIHGKYVCFITINTCIILMYNNNMSIICNYPLKNFNDESLLENINEITLCTYNNNTIIQIIKESLVDK